MKTVLHDLEAACRKGLISDISLHFSRYLSQIDPLMDDSVLVAGALAGEYAISGEVCVDLKKVAGNTIFSIDENDSLDSPNFTTWVEALKKSTVIGDGVNITPLVLTKDGHLYLYKYFILEKRLADLIDQRVENSKLNNISIPDENINKYFDKNDRDQILSVKLACDLNFLIICGGPGTGKTATAAKILALFFDKNIVSPDKVALCAPTGKAAAHLRKSISATLSMFSLSDDKLLPEARTIHRLLGVSLDYKPRLNSNYLLNYKLLILDEASMVDLALFVNLLEACPSDIRIILLGDPDQLSSVETGAVFGDICEALLSKSDEPCITKLAYSRRFDPRKSLARLAFYVQTGRGQEALDVLKDQNQFDAGLVNIGDAGSLSKLLETNVVPAYVELMEMASRYSQAEELFYKFNEVMILCVHRNGIHGVKEINNKVINYLDKKGLKPHGMEIFPGLPIIVTKNNLNLGVFNGDLGLVMADAKDPQTFKAMFYDVEGKEFFVNLHRLEYQIAYCNTVHKAQGSQAKRVILILPQKPSQILCRELVYTAITRSIESVQIWGQETVFLNAVDESSRKVIN